MRRVTLRVESLDGRIVPGSNARLFGQEGNLMGGIVLLGSNTDKGSEETNLMGNATGGHGGNANATGGVELFGVSKPSVGGGSSN